ncbi:Protein of uncharacterised function (DUF1602) [Streptococcus pneumoniae]|nr:Protein of uncharacterised function (DUF1602) [Streptococcus pneumoniae]
MIGIIIGVSSVVVIMVFPSLFKSTNNCIIWLPVLVSKAPVGSSARIIEGLFTKARAMATRCF